MTYRNRTGLIKYTITVTVSNLILVKNKNSTWPNLEIDDICLKIALLISFDNDNPRRAAILKPRSIRAE